MPTAYVVAPSSTPTRTPPATSTPIRTPTSTPTASPTPEPVTPTTIPTPAPPESGLFDPAEREGQLLIAVNALRADAGLPAYQHVPELSAAARAHSCDLASHHMISHVSSDGRTLGQRLPARTPALLWPSESIAAGTADPAEVIALWMDEPPEGWHRRNLLDPQQTLVGLGYCYSPDDPSGNHHYWTMDIARER